MKQTSQMTRLTDAQAMVNQLVQSIQNRAETKMGMDNDRLGVNAYTVGYLNSVLAHVAAVSPAAFKELASVVVYTKASK